MGRLVPTCALLGLTIACTRPNELFGLGLAPGASDMSSGPPEPIYCPDFDPRGDLVDLRELGGATPACDAAARATIYWTMTP